MTDTLIMFCAMCASEKEVIDGGHYFGSRDGDEWNLRLACGHYKAHSTLGEANGAAMLSAIKALKNRPSTDLASEIELLASKGTKEQLADKVIDNLGVILSAIRK